MEKSIIKQRITIFDKFEKDKEKLVEKLNELVGKPIKEVIFDKEKRTIKYKEIGKVISVELLSNNEVEVTSEFNKNQGDDFCFAFSIGTNSYYEKKKLQQRR